MSLRTSEVERLSRPLAVNLAYSSSATLAESIFTALVLEIPNVRVPCLPAIAAVFASTSTRNTLPEEVDSAPMSLSNSDADLPSICVPLTLKKSSSATALFACRTLLFEIPTSKDTTSPKLAMLAVLASISTRKTSPEAVDSALISDRTSDVDLLSRPFAVNLAYSSSATLVESIFTALVLEMPNVRVSCFPAMAAVLASTSTLKTFPDEVDKAPISDKTSEFDLLSRPLAVNLAYSSSATSAESILTAFVLDMPNVRESCFPDMAEVFASISFCRDVPDVDGNLVAIAAVFASISTRSTFPELVERAPISESTSEFDLLSKPFAVNLAYSSSATDAESIFTALVLEIPNVKEFCLPEMADVLASISF